jgi:signal transduction histidine kinase
MRTRLDLALRRERSPDELKTALSETREEVVRLATLAGRLLDSAAHAHGPLVREQVDLIAIARDAVASTQSAATARHVTISITGADSCVASANAESVRQALDNLLSNALKFAPDGSTIVVTVKLETGRLMLSVKDQGPGIPEAEREIVFEPFHRVRGGPPGTGLGLTIVREIATRHGGRSYVAPSTQGAEIVLEFPAG